MKKVLIYFTQFNSALGGSEYIPLLFIAELQKTCDITLALNWSSDVVQAAKKLDIVLDIDKLHVVYVKPQYRIQQKLDSIIPIFSTRRLKALAQKADICISTANLADFGKPAHHFIYLLRTFGDNAFNDYVCHNQQTPWSRFKQMLRTSLAEKILRPLLGVRSTRKIVADPREHIYPNSQYVQELMRNFYGDFNSTVFYPPTLFTAKEPKKEPNLLKIVTISQLFPEKRLMDIIDIVERARALSGQDLRLCMAGPLQATQYVKQLKDIASRKTWITLVGGIYGNEKEAFLRSATYAIHAERDEAFGISVTEYLKAGLIPIVPDEGGTPEIVDSPALTYHTNEEAAQILSHLLTGQAFREEQRRHCEERAKFFSREAYMKQQHQLLDSFLQG